MKSRKKGDRHPLLLYRRVMGRLWAPALVLGLLLLLVWIWGWFYPTPLLEGGDNIWLAVAGLLAGLAALVVAVIALVKKG